MKKTQIRGIKNFRLSTEFFNSPEMIIMNGRYGIAGPMFTMLVLCDVYRNGYFVQWNWLRIFTILRSLPGVTEALVHDMMRDLGELGVFDKEMLKTGIVTSAKIQREYFSRRKPKTDIEYQYVIIDLNQPKVQETPKELPDDPGEEYCLTHTRDTSMFEKPQAKAINPPTLQEVTDAIHSEDLNWANGTDKDAKDFFENYSWRGWLDADGRPLINWKYALLDWLVRRHSESA